jgi:glycosyltransferase involved in cell wall biosynthesis
MHLCIKCNVPYVNVIHSVPEGVYWPDDLEIERQRPLYHSSKRLLFISERNREFMETQYATRFSNYGIVRNPYNADFHSQPAWPVTETPLRLACVARLELYAKGQDLLWDVLSLPKWRERALTIDLFGRGPNEWVIREQIKRLNLTSLVVRGHVDNITSIWTDHHALILPSRQEGLPLALVEAFVCGRPAVVTRVGGNAELVEDGINGFVAPAPTVELMDQALDRLWENRTHLKEMGSAARKTAEKKIPQKPVEMFVENLLALLPKN